MARWVSLSLCLVALFAPLAAFSKRPPGGAELGAGCLLSLECGEELSCADRQGVLADQCSAGCSDDASCQARFGAQSMCIAVDRCVRTCDDDSGCPAGIGCNAYGWCEAVGQKVDE